MWSKIPYLVFAFTLYSVEAKRTLFLIVVIVLVVIVVAMFVLGVSRFQIKYKPPDVEAHNNKMENCRMPDKMRQNSKNKAHS